MPTPSDNFPKLVRPLQRSAAVITVMLIWAAWILASGWLPSVPRLWSASFDGVVRDFCLLISLMVAGYAAVLENYIPVKTSRGKRLAIALLLLVGSVSFAAICWSNLALFSQH